jgi:formimidoylglutamate deiminase
MASIWFETALTAHGWRDKVRLTLAGGRVERLESEVEQGPDDLRGGIALPGLCNVHSHAFQRGMAGLTEYRGASRDDFWSWRELMYRFLGRMGPEEMQAIAAFAFAEMLEGGFTRVGEFHYLHHAPDGAPYADLGEMAARIAAAAQTTGIGLTLLPVYYAQGGFDGAPTTEGQRRFLNNIDRYAHLLERSGAAIADLEGANMGVAPHSLRAVMPDDLAQVAALGAAGPIHIHAAEQVKEVQDCLAATGKRPVQWLLDKAGLDERWCLIHATHLDPDETRRLATSGAVAGLCPVTEANLGDGIFPAAAYLGEGGRFGVGTDSNIAISAPAELRGLEYSQRLSHQARNVLASLERSTGARLFHGALAGGAQALGVSGKGLAEGKAADLVSLDSQHPDLYGRRGDALLDSLVFGLGRDAIDGVWRAGRQVVRAGRHIERDRLLAEYRRALAKVLAA